MSTDSSLSPDEAQQELKPLNTRTSRRDEDDDGVETSSSKLSRQYNTVCFVESSFLSCFNLLHSC